MLIERVTERDYQKIFLAWERLRPWYLSAYIATYVTVLWIFWVHTKTDLEFWILFGIQFILANLFFMLGPGLESYLSFLGWKVRFLRIALLVAGTLFACTIAWFVLLDYNQGFYYKWR